MHKSDHVRDVYAHYGLAMYLAQCLEQSIFIHLMFFDLFPKQVLEFKDTEHWQREFERYETQELGKSMGQIIQKLKEAGQPTEEIKVSLAAALKARNRLAHMYFSEHAIPFTQQSGRDAMIKELEGIQSMFRAVAKSLDDITMPVARKFGLTEEHEKLAVDELMAMHGFPPGSQDE
jgi:hypothetical protein